MSQNILESIVEKRREDIKKLGFTMGFSVPEKRLRGEPVPFISEKGTVLEIKRASPSKGDIAPQLDAALTAKRYAEAGTSAISVLTESHWFKGNLEDLINVCQSVDDFSQKNNCRKIAVLRKDFLLEPEEIEIAYRCGADAVLLISRILDTEKMTVMAKKSQELGMTAFIELRLAEDIEKLSQVCKSVDKKYLVCGVNARDLSDFSIDLLTPCRMLSKIKAVLGEDARVIFESGIRTPQAAQFAGSLGFTGLLLGEAAARNPEEAKSLVENFVNAKGNDSSKAWLNFANLLQKRNDALEEEKSHCHHGTKRERPLVKVCGLTKVNDALYATMGGADFLGFIFWKGTKRNASAQVVLQVKEIINEQFTKTCQDEHIFAAGCDDAAPLLVGVIVDCTSEESRTAIDLVKKHKLDFLQLHGEKAIREFFADQELCTLPHYCVVNVSSEKDLELVEKLRMKGEPRILLDAKTEKQIGGTGTQIDSSLLEGLKKKTKLWLAGGISPENVSAIIDTLHPELIDVNSGVEKEPGLKDDEKILALFNEIG